MADDNSFLFSQSIANCFLTYGDSGDPTVKVRPHPLATPSAFPELDPSGAVALEAGEVQLLDLPGILARMAKWSYPLGYDETKPTPRSMSDRTSSVAWQGRCDVSVTDRRVIHRAQSPSLFPGMSGRNLKKLTKAMAGEPVVFGQIRFEWLAWLSFNVAPTDSTKLVMLARGADTTHNVSGKAETLVPFRLTYQLETNDPAGLLSRTVDQLRPVFDSMTGEMDRALDSTGSLVLCNDSPKLPDGRGYVISDNNSAPHFQGA